jgi:hypothetical protein
LGESAAAPAADTAEAARNWRRVVGFIGVSPAVWDIA